MEKIEIGQKKNVEWEEVGKEKPYEGLFRDSDWKETKNVGDSEVKGGKKTVFVEWLLQARHWAEGFTHTIPFDPSSHLEKEVSKADKWWGEFKRAWLAQVHTASKWKISTNLNQGLSDWKLMLFQLEHISER